MMKPVFYFGFNTNKIVGVVKSLVTDGGKVISHCISVQCKCRFRLFASSSKLISTKAQQVSRNA